MMTDIPLRKNGTLQSVASASGIPPPTRRDSGQRVVLLQHRIPRTKHAHTASHLVDGSTTLDTDSGIPSKGLGNL